MAFSPQPTIGNDTITGDSANDVIDGLDGNDVIDGGGGNDKLTGGAGNDDLNGNIGNDILIGGSGDDTYTIDSAKDKITESITNANGGGHDRVKIVGSGFTIYTLGANLDDLDMSGAAGNINGKGNDLANTIMGNSGDNVLDGGKGADTLIGGDGDDTYIQDHANDVIQEQFDQGEDTLKTSVAVTNAIANVETYVFKGKGIWNFYGDGSANHAIGGAAVDFLDGGDGDDILDGGKNADFLQGGLGDDTYIIDNVADRAIEVAGEGTDKIITSVSIDLSMNGRNIENAEAKAGKLAINLTGNDSDNNLTGNAGKNILDGGVGSDTLDGGDGDDTYIVDSLGDVVNEKNGGKIGGKDLVKSSVDFILGNNFENLTLTGSNNINGTGNGLINTITGNSGDNILDGGAANDILIGGGGNDIYIVDQPKDAVKELKSGGIDTIRLAVGAAAASFNLKTGSVTTPTFKLQSEVENLDFSTAITGFTLIGSKSANHLTGGMGDDRLNGSFGSDVLDGGAGNDTAIYAFPFADKFSTKFFRFDAAKGSDGVLGTADDILTIVDINKKSARNEGPDSLMNIEFLEFGKAGSKTFTKMTIPHLYADGDNAADQVQENAAGGTTVGLTIQATQVDIGQTITYSLVDDAGGRFQIDANTGIVKVAAGASLDYEVATSHQIVIKAIDDRGLFSTKAYTIAVTNQNEAPTVTGQFAGAVAEDGTLIATGQVTVNDPDVGESGTQIANGNATYGTFSVDGSGNWQYDLNNNDAAVQALNGGQKLIDSFDIFTIDGTKQTITLTITGINENIDLAAFSNAEGFRIDGAVLGDQSGRSVSSAGDINGDGFADLIVGAFVADPSGRTGAGSSYVIFGKSGGLVNIDLASLSPTDGFRIDGELAGELSGWSVSSAGDVNGDGFSDLMIGATSANPFGRNFAGSSYVIFGKSGGLANLDLASLSMTDGFRIDGALAGDRIGFSVSSAGDVNGDGFADLIMGASAADPFGRNLAGSSYVIFGKAIGLANLDLANLAATDGFRIDGALAGDRSGFFVASAGDVNGDGFGDLLVGAPYADPLDPSANPKIDAGSSYVIFGKSGGLANIDLANLSATDGFRIDGALADDQSGFSVSSAGDINGDGFDDLIVGAAFADPSGRNDAGSSYVIFGKSSGLVNIDLASLSATDGFRIDGAVAVDRSGRSVSSAGDVNGDGFGDLIVGAYSADPSGRNTAGTSYVIFGKSSGLADIDLASLSPMDGFRIDGAVAGDSSGRSVSSAGDVNGDGFDDLIVGAPSAGPSGRNGAGSSYVIYGGDFLVKITHLGSALTGTASSDIMVGTSGNDNISGGGGSDSIRSGSGDDVITISDLSFAHIAGGLGTDRLVFATGAGTIDFADLDNNAATKDASRIAGIEILDFTNGATNTITLSVADLLSLDVDIRDVGGNASLDNVLRIEGDGTDSLDLDLGAGASQWAIDGSLALAGFTIYSTNGTSDALMIAVSSNIAVI